jgi:hypothetical protein
MYIVSSKRLTIKKYIVLNLLAKKLKSVMYLREAVWKPQISREFTEESCTVLEYQPHFFFLDKKFRETVHCFGQASSIINVSKQTFDYTSKLEFIISSLVNCTFIYHFHHQPHVSCSHVQFCVRYIFCLVM